MTLDDRKNLLNSQNGVCAICKQGNKRLVIDHCHSSGKVRGILCDSCNRGLGHFYDNESLLSEAILYLLKEE